MLGDKIKEFINKHLECEDCQRVMEVPTKGICCDRCGHEYRMSDEIKEELDQLIASHNRVKDLEKLLNFDSDYNSLKHDLELHQEEIEAMEKALEGCHEAGKTALSAYLKIKEENEALIENKRIVAALRKAFESEFTLYCCSDPRRDYEIDSIENLLKFMKVEGDY